MRPIKGALAQALDEANSYRPEHVPPEAVLLASWINLPGDNAQRGNWKKNISWKESLKSDFTACLNTFKPENGEVGDQRGGAFDLRKCTGLGHIFVNRVRTSAPTPVFIAKARKVARNSGARVTQNKAVPEWIYTSCTKIVLTFFPKAQARQIKNRDSQLQLKHRPGLHPDLRRSATWSSAWPVDFVDPNCFACRR